MRTRRSAFPDRHPSGFLRRTTALRAGTCFMLCLSCLSVAMAQLPRTTITSVFPPGAQVGTALDVTVRGPTIIGVDQLVFSHPGIRAEVKRAKRDEFATVDEPQFGQFRVVIGKDVPPGRYEVRAIGAHGLSNPRCFTVGTMPELPSPGSHRSPAQACDLPLDTVVNGTTAGSAVDYYAVQLAQGQRVAIIGEARSIDSRLNAVLSVIDDRGVELEQAFVVERDPILFFEAPRAGKYLVAVRDEIYSGGDEYFYRLHVTTGPVMLAAHPRKSLANNSVEVRLLGWNLGSQPDPKTRWLFQDHAIEAINVQAQLASPEATLLAPIVPQFPDLIVGTTEARRYRVADFGQLDLPVALAPLQGESEEATTAERPQQVPIPVEIAGTFYPQADEDWYEFQATAGQQLWIEVLSHRMGTDCDPYLLIQQVDAKDPMKVTDVLQADDPSNRNATIRGSYAISSDDPSVLWTVPRDGTYRLMVRDQFGSARRDPRAMYRLVIRPPQPSCRVIAVPQELKAANGNVVPPAAISLRRGESAAIRLLVDRREGYSEDVTVEATNLPKGVSASAVVIGPTDNQAWLVLQASADASAYVGPLQLKASSANASVRTIPACVVSGTTNRQLEPARLRPTRSVMLAVSPADPVPVTLEVAAAMPMETARGGQLTIPVKVTRAKGFDEPITLVAQGLPREITVGNATIAKGKSDGTMTLTIKNANAKPGVYSFVIRGDTKQKRVLDAISLKASEATQKRLGEVLSRLTKETADLKKKVDAANKALQTAQAELQAAEKKLKAVAGKPEAPAVQKQVEEAQAKLASAKDQLQSLQKTYNESEAARKRAEALKKSADAAVANAKKLAAPKDAAFAALSQPVVVRVHQSPISLAIPPAAKIPLGGSTEVAAKIERKFGFADVVQLRPVIPKGVSGISIPTVKIDKGKAQQAIKITVAKNAKPGTYPIQLNATARFNNVPVTATATLELTVTPPSTESRP